MLNLDEFLFYDKVYHKKYCDKVNSKKYLLDNSRHVFKQETEKETTPMVPNDEI